jgi:hypothetical protein
MAGDEAFETSEDELRQMGWLSPEDRKAIAQGIDFLATTHHEGQHADMIHNGQRMPASCDAKSCKYATELLTWLRKERT